MVSAGSDVGKKKPKIPGKVGIIPVKSHGIFNGIFLPVSPPENFNFYGWEKKNHQKNQGKTSKKE